MSEGRHGPVARVLLWMLDFYQKGISPLTPPSCRFEPTCSSYAVEAVRVHGAWYGTWLSVWRLLRCGPWTPGGWDPVPEPRAPDDFADHPHEHPDNSERS
ncbi:MAG: membrane protein insertion efficiency factor YidD [Dietzia sp.]